MSILKIARSYIVPLFLLAGLLASPLVLAETAVVIHPDNASELSEKDIQRIFLGKQKSFPSGEGAIPVDQNKGSAVRDAFFASVLGKSEQQVKSYWSRLVFTGKGTPPKEVGDSAAVLKLVATNPNTIGYIDAALVDASVKVVHKF